MRKSLSIIIVILVLLSCNNNDSETLKSLKQQIEEREIAFDNTAKHIVIIEYQSPNENGLIKLENILQ